MSFFIFSKTHPCCKENTVSADGEDSVVHIKDKATTGVAKAIAMLEP